jgi:hypothetical protein
VLDSNYHPISNQWMMKHAEAALLHQATAITFTRYPAVGDAVVVGK